jgi:hypothetical protein
VSVERDDLVNDAERVVWEAFSRGVGISLGTDDPSGEDFVPEVWAEQREVRGEVISALLLGAQHPDPGHVAKVWLAGAKITGLLSLNGGETTSPLTLVRCVIVEKPNLNYALTRGVSFRGCRMAGLSAHRCVTTGQLDLDGTRFAGPVVLAGARVTGDLNLTGAVLSGPGPWALMGDQLKVDGSLSADGLLANGLVRISGAEIAGQLSLNGAKLSSGTGVALMAEHLDVGGDVNLRNEFTATGEVRLTEGRIGGQFDLTTSTLNNISASALSADGITVQRGTYCDRITVSGEVRIPNAMIGGQLGFNGAILSNPGGDALVADGVVVRAGMYCAEGFTATGSVRLPSAAINGQLVMVGAQIENSSGVAVGADLMTVDGSMQLPNANVSGTMRLSSARIRDQLNMDGAELSSPGGVALRAERLSVGGDVLCRQLKCDGVITLFGASVGGGLHLDGAAIGVSVTMEPNIALTVGDAVVDRITMPTSIRGIVQLANASVGRLTVSSNSIATPTELNGLTYRALDIDDGRLDVHKALGWLRRDPNGYHPQPYEQLGALYRSLGEDREMRKVHLAKQRARRSRLTIPGRFFGWLLDGLAGYGYAPGRAFGWLLAALLAGGYLVHQTASSPLGWLDSFLLAFDSLIPTSPLGIRSSITPSEIESVILVGLQALGFLLSIAVLPAVTRALSRRDSTSA